MRSVEIKPNRRDLRTTIRHQSRKMRKRNFVEQIFVLSGIVAAIRITSFDIRSSCLTEVTRQLCKIVDEDIGFRRDQAFLIAQPISYATGDDAGSSARLNICVPISNHHGMS